jgi:hypothetical protein
MYIYIDRCSYRQMAVLNLLVCIYLNDLYLDRYDTLRT